MIAGLVFSVKHFLGGSSRRALKTCVNFRSGGTLSRLTSRYSVSGVALNLNMKGKGDCDKFLKGSAQEEGVPRAAGVPGP